MICIVSGSGTRGQPLTLSEQSIFFWLLEQRSESSRVYKFERLFEVFDVLITPNVFIAKYFFPKIELSEGNLVGIYLNIHDFN